MPAVGGRGLAAVAALAAGVLVGGPLSGQSVHSARLVADLTAGDGSAQVSIEYELSGPPADGGVDASALDFGPETVREVVGGEPLTPLSVARGVGTAWATRLPAVPAGSSGVAMARARYRVDAAAQVVDGVVRGRLPVLAARLLPERTRPELFQAEVRLPPEWVVTEGFPTGLTATGEPGVYRVTLPVVPSLVSFRARSDGAWRPGLPAVLDAMAVALLLAFSVVGWRHLRVEPT